LPHHAERSGPSSSALPVDSRVFINVTTQRILPTTTTDAGICLFTNVQALVFAKGNFKFGCFALRMTPPKFLANEVKDHVPSVIIATSIAFLCADFDFVNNNMSNIHTLTCIFLLFPIFFASAHWDLTLLTVIFAVIIHTAAVFIIISTNMLTFKQILSRYSNTRFTVWLSAVRLALVLVCFTFGSFMIASTTRSTVNVNTLFTITVLARTARIEGNTSIIFTNFAE